HGEGTPGILTERAGAWFYKRNLSPINVQGTNDKTHLEAKFAPVELVALKPNLALGDGAQLMDLAGDGQPDLVVLDGPAPGFYEHDLAEGWNAFRPFTARLNRDTRDPNLKFVDLNGDGHADVLITEEQAFVWHPALGEAGFGPARRVHQVLDEEKGPRLVFADGTQSIYLADLSGDGLTDLVRIRNGAVCYWPNLGYGRFGAKVSMDNAPWFDAPDQFNQQRIHLADIDGSGTTDILYLHGQGVRIYFNQSGNSWSAAQTIPFPVLDNLTAVQVLDLLGDGTACLLWSSPLPGATRQPMHYLKLMGEAKPHLLVKSVNNLGAETRVSYAPSTKFYLADKVAGKPWVSKLPFPVHVVERVTVIDKWRQTRFTTSYSYHHGYFDGVEREFRGFGRIEQIDSEAYGTFQQANSNSPYIAADNTLYQPPVKTTTWYHTGVFLDRDHLLSHFAHEYFAPGQEHTLPEPQLDANLTAQEWREAVRACKGMILRQEVVELDVAALEQSEELPVKLFSTAYHNCQIQRVQPQANNRHAVFLVAESETITYHYDLDLRTAVPPDPRIAHTLNLKFDEYANILQTVAVVYARQGNPGDEIGGLTDKRALIGQVQSESHLTYGENHFTKDFGDLPAEKPLAQDNHRLRQLCEVSTYALTGVKPSAAFFTLADLQALQLSQLFQSSGTPVADIGYHQLADPNQRQKRLIEQTRTLFFAENLVDPLPFGQHGRLGLRYEQYKLALTDELLATIFGDDRLAQTLSDGETARGLINNAANSGYLSGADLHARFATFPPVALSGQYWIRSGTAGFSADAPQHFYTPERYSDPFGKITTLQYDTKYDLFLESSSDALGNTIRVTQFDYRVLAPRAMQDSNNNLSELYFDVLGLPTALAVQGKGDEGDNLTGFGDAVANPDWAELTAFFTQPNLDEAQARLWLGNATARHVYSFG
ncbi:MAG: toxin TcdB middle/N-terminal domain-containing protein, partial [Caldilineaceae bacterium]